MVQQISLKHKFIGSIPIRCFFYHSLFRNDTWISISYILNNVLIGYHTFTDLSLLQDFENFKSKLDLVNKNLITVGKGFIYEQSQK